jgi:hypothetical protein
MAQSSKSWMAKPAWLTFSNGTFAWAGFSVVVIGGGYGYGPGVAEFLLSRRASADYRHLWDHHHKIVLCGGFQLFPPGKIGRLGP